MNITADEVRKTHELFDNFTGPFGGKYSLWKKGNRIVGIHDDDDDIVSIFDLDTKQYIYLDKKTKKGIKIIDATRK
ncbi:hypothetical protein KKH23_07810 [Patescibacteria group bacterium]|nr:hypothetical protein [Patescibacteria group bacterium]